MGIYIACQCGQAFSAAVQLAGQTLPCPSCGRPLVIPVPAAAEPAAPPVARPAFPPAATALRPGGGSTRDRNTLPLLVLGAIGGLAAIVAIVGLASWALWDRSGSDRDTAQRPVAASRTNEERPSRPSRQPSTELVDRLTGAAAGGNSAGHTHRSADGGIEFWLPAGARSETRKSFGTSAGLADRTRITWGTRSSGELVGTVYLYRGRHDDLAADTRMKVGVTQGLYQAYGSRVSQSYSDITHAEFTGTECVIQVPGQRDNTMRFLYTGDYLVTVEAIGPPGFATSAPAVKFFNSLRLVAGE